MPAIRTLASLRTAATLLGAMLLVPLLSACPKGDVGAPCNHGDVQAPDSQVVTFPALSCNDLLCVFAQKDTPPKAPCTGNPECNTDGGNRFQCVNKACKLSSTYVLERSMCSKTCSTDADCKDGGIGKKVLSADSSCENGFTCAPIQTLGEFCCQKLCVCADDISAGSVAKVNEECAAFDKDAEGNPMCNVMEMTPGVTTDAADTAATMP
jgi:hypothetical protein